MQSIVRPRGRLERVTNFLMDLSDRDRPALEAVVRMEDNCVGLLAKQVSELNPLFTSGWITFLAEQRQKDREAAEVGTASGTVSGA